MEQSFISQLLTSLSTAGLVGFLFWAWINNKFSYMERIDDESRSRIHELEKKNMELLTKDDHFEIRKEDKATLERQLYEMKKDIKDMPEKIVNLLKPFLK